MREDFKSQTVILDVIKDGQKVPLGIRGNSWDAQKLLLFLSILRNYFFEERTREKHTRKQTKKKKKAAKQTKNN